MHLFDIFLMNFLIFTYYLNDILTLYVLSNSKSTSTNYHVAATWQRRDFATPSPRHELPRTPRGSHVEFLTGKALVNPFWEFWKLTA